MQAAQRGNRSGGGRQSLRAHTVALLLAGTVAALEAGCRSVPPAGVTAAAPVWPPAPSAPRVAYLGSVRGPADLGIRAGFWRKAADWVLGVSRDLEFVKPVGVFIDNAGNLCVADAGSGSVSYFNLAQKTWRRWDRVGKVRLVSPVAVVKHGDVFFVADSVLRKVLAFDVTGRPQFEISAGLGRPAGLAVAGDTLLVADGAAHCVKVYDLGGRPLRDLGKRGNGPGEFNFPTHLAVDAAGRIYVTDAMNSRIQVFDRDERPLRVIGSLGDSSGHFSRPKGVAADRFGHVYVVDALFDNVQVFDLEGRFLMDWGDAGAKPGQFWLPAGIAIGADNQIAVADAFNRRVQLFKYIGGAD